MKVSDVYGGDYLKCEHLQGQDVSVQISGSTVEEVGDEKKRQIVLQFTGHERRLGLNKTNAETIASMYGDDTTAWTGHAITLWPDASVMFGGKAVGGVRVRPVPPQGMAPTTPTPVAAPPVAQAASVPVQF